MEIKGYDGGLAGYMTKPILSPGGPNCIPKALICQNTSNDMFLCIGSTWYE